MKGWMGEEGKDRRQGMDMKLVRVSMKRKYGEKVKFVLVISN